VVVEAAYGDRQLSNHIFMQPGDNLIEPSRRMLRNTTGTDSATMNFNAVDHPFAEYSYPITFETRVAPCNNACTGDLEVGGVACGAKSWDLFVTYHEPDFAGEDVNGISTSVSIPAVKTCECVDGAAFIDGACILPPED
jgi:hypothetical protein